MFYTRRIKLTTNLLALLFVSSGLPVQAQDSGLEEFAIQSRKNDAQFRSMLKRTRRVEIESIGLASMAEVCRVTAPQLYHEFSTINHIVLRRVSLNPRNVVIGHADAWEQAGLLEIQKKLLHGSPVKGMEIVELVQEPAEKYYRYLSPILAEESCMQCHGTEKELNKDAINGIHFHYPDDNAIGYQVDDLMGAISIIKVYDE